MNKSKSINNNFYRTNLALICIIGMMAGFLFSRALLSSAMIGFCLVAFYKAPVKRILKDKWWWLGILWVLIYALSGLWSDNKNEWLNSITNKVPFVVLPPAFALLPRFSKKQLWLFTLAIGLLLTICALYSSYFFFRDPSFYTDQYIISKVLPTPAHNDHIRFSLSIALYIVWALYYWPQLGILYSRLLTGTMVAILAAYLHLLAARTGLIVLYLFLSSWGIYATWKKSKLALTGILLSIVVIAALAVQYVPTLKNRIGYLSYTLILLNRGEISGIYSDMGRLISYDISARQIKENPLLGVGAGDLYASMREGYNKWYPDVAPELQLLPHNEFIVVAMGCGLLCMVIFTVWVFMPLVWIRRNRDGFFLFVVWLSLFASILVEPAFEIQYGVFVYLFFILWQRYALTVYSIQEASSE